ncbi:MAG TPA: hypothetical protein VHC70_05035, partial [Phycisphaerales bacterium]|nr:hypothetical protein [Phycisphaerales bacterium]
GPKMFDPLRQRPFVDPFIIADTLDVAFEPSKDQPDEVDPVRAVATGSVQAATQDASIKGQSLEASMARDADHAIAVTDFVGRGGDSAQVEITRTDGVSAKADSVRANPVLKTADLSGDVALAKGPSVIHCDHAEMDESSGTLRIIGAGTFDRDQAHQTPLTDASSEASAAPKPDPTHIFAKWSGSMIFNNAAGTLDASGNTKVISTSALQTQTLLADRLQLWITPAGDAKPAGPPQAQPSSDPTRIALGDDRQLLKAQATGASEQREGAAYATIEVRKYAANPAAAGSATLGSGTRPNAPAILPSEAADASQPDRVLEQVFYVEGPKIIADEQAGTITVPAAGRAIIRDQRAANSQALIANSSGVPAAGEAASAKGAKGTSRFTWAESMQFTRSTGTLTMKKDVELIHLPLGSSQVTRLVAMRMDARFNVLGGAGQPVAPGSAQRSAELVEAVATGAVYAESGPQKLLCDRISYDALRGTAEASALANNRVTLHDDRQSTPVVAKRLFWDLVKDRIEIMEPAPITAPR